MMTLISSLILNLIVFLFCACKHREGSDIKNLDCCIFLDKEKLNDKHLYNVLVEF